MTPHNPYERMSRDELLAQLTFLEQRTQKLEQLNQSLDRAQNFIRESDHHYRSLFENSPISLWEMDMSGLSGHIARLHEHGVADLADLFESDHPSAIRKCLQHIKIISVNRATLRLLEAERKDTLFDRLDEILPEESLPVLERMLTALAQGSAELTEELDLITLRGGFRRVMLHYCTAPGCKRSMTGAIVSIMDITERKQLEDRLLQSTREALQASAAKGRFLANMSHEIRTPMNAILGMADLLRDTRLDDEQQTYVDIFNQAGQKLLGIINDLLDLSRIEAGKITPASVVFNPADLVEESCLLLEPKARAKDLVLSRHVAPEIPSRLIGDPARVQQILINFIDNALKFTHRGKISVELRPAPERAGIMPGTMFLDFSVSDTGIGIAEPLKEDIFQSFYQADDSATKRYEGTGLGLTISNQLAELLGGKISLNSRPEQGSTFTLHVPFRLPPDRSHTSSEPEETIPIQPAPRTPAPTLQATAPQPSSRPSLGRSGQGKTKRRILLAEDSANNRLLIEFFLKRSPHALDVVTNGREALQAFKNNTYDIVLMDIQMAEMDGHAATREIRAWEQHTGRHPVPILAMSAHAMDADQNRSLKAGCNGHLSKPVKKRDLLDAIDRYCNQCDVCKIH
jgi:signal transduction histidine kinase/CheY-like chemotaxis protein